jgi:hypothetical protein
MRSAEQAARLLAIIPSHPVAASLLGGIEGLISTGVEIIEVVTAVPTSGGTEAGLQVDSDRADPLDG